LEVFRSNPDLFDMLITDYTMPHMTGVDLAEEFLRIRPDIPVILCTGYTEKVTRDKAIKLGIRDMVMKPFDRKEFAKLVRAVLDQTKA